MRIVMDDGYCATTVMDGGGSWKRKWKGRGTEVWRKRKSLSVPCFPPYLFSFPPIFDA